MRVNETLLNYLIILMTLLDEIVWVEKEPQKESLAHHRLMSLIYWCLLIKWCKIWCFGITSLGGSQVAGLSLILGKIKECLSHKLRWVICAYQIRVMCTS